MNSVVGERSIVNYLKENYLKILLDILLFGALAVVYVYSSIWIKLVIGFFTALYFLPRIFGSLILYFTDQGYKTNSVFWEIVIAFILFPSHYLAALLLPLSLLIFLQVPPYIVLTLFLLIMFLPPIGYFSYLFYLSLRDKNMSFIDFIRVYATGKYHAQMEAINQRNSERIENFYDGLERVEKRLSYLHVNEK